VVPQLLTTGSGLWRRVAAGLEALAASDKFRRVAAEIRAGVELCRGSCEHFGLCGGGTGSNKYWEHGRFDCTQTQHCRYCIQLVADVVLEGLEQELGLTACAG